MKNTTHITQGSMVAPVPSGLTLAELLSYRAQHQPHQLAYQYLHRGEHIGRQLTYIELQRQAEEIARRLVLAEAAGKRALLLFAPGLDFVAAFLGCLHAGVTAVPAYPPRKNNKMQRLQSIVSDANAIAVLTTSNLSDKIRHWFDADSPLGHARWICVDDVVAVDNTSDASNLEARLLANQPAYNPLAFLQYTSGSTGTPKGVMVSQENLIHNLGAIYKCFGHSADSKGVIWLPPYHDMGLIGGILQPLYGGFPVTLMSPVDFLQKPLRWLQAISTHRATTSGGPDFAYDLCVRKAQSLLAREEGASQLSQLDLSCWQVAFTGAEPVRSDTLARFSEMFAPYGFRKTSFYPCYGMAEATLIISGGAVNTAPTMLSVDAAELSQHRVEVVERDMAPTEVTNDQADTHDNLEHLTVESAIHLVSCGKSLDDQQIVVVNPETLRPCEPNQVGEIWVSGESVAQGYWQQPGRSWDTFKAYIADSQQGPFLRTGDLGFVHEHELYVTGRIKDMMIVRGVNYYPHDIERTVETCHPALRSDAIAAFSVDIRGAERLVVIAEVERSWMRKLDVQPVIESIRRAVTAQYDLQTYATLLVRPGQIPKTSSGKIQRYRCRELFLAGDLAVVKDWSESPKHKTEFVKLQAEVDSVLAAISPKK